MRLPSFAWVPWSPERRKRGSLLGQRDISLRKWTGYFTEAGLEDRFLLFRQGGRRPVFFLIVLALFIFEIVDTIRDSLTNTTTNHPLEIFRKTTKFVGTSCFMVFSWWFPFPFKYFEKAVGVLVVVTSFLLSWATDRFAKVLAGRYDDYHDQALPAILLSEALHFSMMIGVYTAVVVIMPLRRPKLIVTLVVSYVFGASAVAVWIPRVAEIVGNSPLVYSCIAALLSSAAVLVAVVFSLTNEEFYARLMFSKIGAQKKKIEMLNDEMEDLLKAKSAGSAGERLVGLLNEASEELQKRETLLESTEGPDAPASSPAFTAEQIRRLVKKLREATALASNAEHLLDINLSRTVKQLDALARHQSPREQTEAPQLIPLARQSGEAEAMREGNQKGSMVSLVSSETGDGNHADERMMQFLSTNFVRQSNCGGVTRPRRVPLSPQSNEAGGVGTGTLLRLGTTKPEMDEAVSVVLKPFEAHLPMSLSSIRYCRDFGTFPPSPPPPPPLTLADRHSSESVPAREWNLDLTALEGQEMVLTNDLVGLGAQSPVSPTRQHKGLIHPEDLHVGGALPLVGLALLRPFIVDPLGQTGLYRILNFLLMVQSGYSTQASYHNAVHGADVALMTVWLTEHVGVRPFLSPVRNVSIVIAALCHDVGHEGVNNMFHINSSSDLAVNYNDRSVLESFHAAQTFRLMQKPGCNILSKLEPEDRKMARSSIIDLILDTDMRKHFEFVAAMKLRLKDPEFASSPCGDTWGSPSSSSEKNVEVMEQDVWMVTRACLKAADLGHSTKPWPVHFARSLAVTEEFFKQGDREKVLSLPISPLCGREGSSPSGLCKSQIGFLNFVCRELYVELSRVEKAARESPRDSPSQKKPTAMNQMLSPEQISSVCLANMEENVEKWKLPETALQVPSQLFDPPPVAPSELSLSIKSRTPRRDRTRESPFAVLPSQTPEEQEMAVPEQTQLAEPARVTSGSASALQHKDKVGKGTKLDRPSGDDEKPPDCSREASLVD